MKKIELFGDSVMRGVVYNEETNRYSICKADRFAALKNSGIEVRNNSHMGATIEKGLDVLKSREKDLDENTLVVLEYGGNDCNFDWKQISDNPEGTFEPKVEESRFVKLYGEAIEFVKKCGAKIALCSIVPLDSEKFMSWITRGNDYKNILKWLGDVNLLYRWQEYYDRLVRAVADKFGLPIIETRYGFAKSHEYGSLICADGIHPTEKGHAIVGNTLCDFVLKNFADTITILPYEGKKCNSVAG